LPGASQNVDLQLNLRDLSMVTDLGGFIVARGKSHYIPEQEFRL
jgi:hypothetical protein